MSDSAAKHHLGHRARLKKRFMSQSTLLEDYEILELILGYALVRRDTKPLAKELLGQFQSIKGLLDAREAEISLVSGVGPGLTTYFRVLKEFMARYAETPARKREILESPEQVMTMAKARLAGLEKEEFWVALVDTQNRLIYWGQLLRGRVKNVPVKARDVIEEAMRHNANAIFLVHNHPGGNLAPSKQDWNFTMEVKALAEKMDMRLLDHIVVTDSGSFSMNREGLL